jgi:hypothetical protein
MSQNKQLNQPKTSQRQRILNQPSQSFNNKTSQLADEEPILKQNAYDTINNIQANDKLVEVATAHMTSKSKSLLSSNKQQKDLQQQHFHNIR